MSGKATTSWPINHRARFAIASIVLFLSLWWLLRHRDLNLTADTLASTLPWFGVLGTVDAIQEARSVPEPLASLLSSPTIYFLVGSAILVLWLVSDHAYPGSRTSLTAGSGVAIFLGAVFALSFVSPIQGIPHVLLWNGIALSLTVLVTALVWGVFRLVEEPVDGWLGPGVLFSHVLDATTTGVGLRVFGTTERNPVAAAIIASGDAIMSGFGVGGFLLVKVVAALLVIHLAASSTDSRREYTLLLVGAGAAGLFPATHNLVLFALTIP